MIRASFFADSWCQMRKVTGLRGVPPQREHVLLFRHYLSVYKFVPLFPPFRSIHRKWWVDSSELARSYLNYYSISIESCHNLLCRKHEVYGADPIKAVGVSGLAIRCLDKLFRLINLTSGVVCNEEGIEDSVMDIFNYCILALLYIDRKL